MAQYRKESSLTRIFVPTFGPSDWRRLLADPKKHWKYEKSAYECAVAWEAARGTARGLPPDIARVLDSEETFSGASLLIGLPEHKVQLEGGGHASQTDLWALLSAPVGLVSLAVEAKASESFDDTVEEWLTDTTARSGKPARLKQLCRLWGVHEDEVKSCRYQLMHRPVTAILEAKRFGLSTAVFLVHAFGDNKKSLGHYSDWRKALKIDNSTDAFQLAGKYSGIDLWMGWVASEPAPYKTLRDAV
jgi:hypothetical protein